jgi:hypothetical protein
MCVCVCVWMCVDMSGCTRLDSRVCVCVYVHERECVYVHEREREYMV